MIVQCDESLDRQLEADEERQRLEDDARSRSMRDCPDEKRSSASA